jgi:hypothetical protein
MVPWPGPRLPRPPRPRSSADSPRPAAGGPLITSGKGAETVQCTAVQSSAVQCSRGISTWGRHRGTCYPGTGVPGYPGTGGGGGGGGGCFDGERIRQLLGRCGLTRSSGPERHQPQAALTSQRTRNSSAKILLCFKICVVSL